jgi:hypothetical protein
VYTGKGGDALWAESSPGKEIQVSIQRERERERERAKTVPSAVNIERI